MTESTNQIVEQIKIDEDSYRIRQTQFGGHYVEAHHDSQPEGEWTSMFFNSFVGKDYWFSSVEEAKDALCRLLASPYPTLVRWLFWGVDPKWNGKSPCDVIFGEDNKNQTVILEV